MYLHKGTFFSALFLNVLIILFVDANVQQKNFSKIIAKKRTIFVENHLSNFSIVVNVGNLKQRLKYLKIWQLKK